MQIFLAKQLFPLVFIFYFYVHCTCDTVYISGSFLTSMKMGEIVVGARHNVCHAHMPEFYQQCPTMAKEAECKTQVVEETEWQLDKLLEEEPV